MTVRKTGPDKYSMKKKIYEDVLDDIDEIKPDIPVQEEDTEEDAGEEMLYKFVCEAPDYVDVTELYERIIGGILSVRADGYRIVHGTHGTNTFTVMFNADSKSLLRILFDVMTQTNLFIYGIYPDGSRSPEFSSDENPELTERSKYIIGNAISTLSRGIVSIDDICNFIDRTMARRRAVSSRNR